jgi:dolichol-phosphate mannosyltransferase
MLELSIVVPVYKEEDSIRPFLTRMENVLHSKQVSYEIIFCLDPSPDRTEEVIMEEINNNSNIRLIVFSRRFGQPTATMAGMLTCTGKNIVVIDVDLQDPPELIANMYDKLKEGYEVVYAKRRIRKGETLLKRCISVVGYYLINLLSDLNIPRNTGDFRIMSRRVVEEIRRLNECHGFLRGLVSHVGFRQTFVEYERHERTHGKGHYNRYIGSLKIGLNGLISFSSRPLQLMSIAGALFAVFSFLIGSFYVVQKLMGVELPLGLPTTTVLITFFAGVQLLSLGLIGEYIGRIYDEAKRRPLYIVDRKQNFPDNSPVADKLQSE